MNSCRAHDSLFAKRAYCEPSIDLSMHASACQVVVAIYAAVFDLHFRGCIHRARWLARLLIDLSDARACVAKVSRRHVVVFRGRYKALALALTSVCVCAKRCDKSRASSPPLPLDSRARENNKSPRECMCVLARAPVHSRYRTLIDQFA